MSRVYVFLADGFEDIEGLTVVDLLRRAGIETTTVSIKEDRTVTTSHGVQLMADALFSETDFSDAEMLVLPGGLPGTDHLREYAPLANLLKVHYDGGKWVTAICAAPTVLSGLGMLEGRTATSHPSRIGELACAKTSTDKVVVDGNVITSRGMGTAMDFGLKMIEILDSAEKAEQIAASIVYER